MEYLSELPNKVNDFDYIKAHSILKNEDHCYIISNYEDIDGQVLEFETAFDKSCGRGLATFDHKSVRQ